MTDPLRPVPRWLHVWAVVTVVATLVLLCIGQLVTSFDAGMADPLWPTEPWYVFETATPAERERFRNDSHYFLEHSHRIFAFGVGGLVIGLAAGLWWTEPRKLARWAALAGVVVLIGGFGELHRELMAQNKRIVARELAKADIQLPLRGLSVALTGLAVALAVAVSGLFTRGGVLRLLGTLALAAVMVQGLFGGVRVLLNELIGPDLAKIHGIFAQVVFGLLTAIAVLTARDTVSDLVTPRARAFGRWAAFLAAVMLVQVVLGAYVRHDPTPLTQKLHMLTAFVAAVVTMWFLHAAFADPATRGRVSTFGRVLALLLVLQIYLGVEAWMTKFAGGPFAEVKLTPHYITTRTAHALAGSCLWAAALAVALRLRPAGARGNTLESDAPTWSATRTGPGVATTHFRGDGR